MKKKKSRFSPTVRVWHNRTRKDICLTRPVFALTNMASLPFFDGTMKIAARCSIYQAEEISFVCLFSTDGCKTLPDSSFNLRTRYVCGLKKIRKHNPPARYLTEPFVFSPDSVQLFVGSRTPRTWKLAGRGSCYDCSRVIAPNAVQHITHLPWTNDYSMSWMSCQQTGSVTFVCGRNNFAWSVIFYAFLFVNRCRGDLQYDGPVNIHGGHGKFQTHTFPRKACDMAGWSYLKP